MSWTFVKWFLIGTVLAGALGTATVYRFKMVSAQAERDTALVEKQAAVANLEVERISTRAALDAAVKAAAETVETLSRTSTALNGMKAETERCRQTLRACRTPEAVADRMGALFP